MYRESKTKACTISSYHFLTHSHAPYPACCGRCLPCCVDAACLHITSAYIIEAKHRTACSSGDYFKLTVEDVFWDLAILHATHVAEASQATHVAERSHVAEAAHVAEASRSKEQSCSEPYPRTSAALVRVVSFLR